MNEQIRLLAVQAEKYAGQLQAAGYIEEYFAKFMVES